MKKYSILFATLVALLAHTIDYAKVKKTSSHLFSKLTIIQNYSIMRPEHPDIDNVDWAYPDYRSFLRTLVPGYFDRFLGWIGIRRSMWTVEAFQSLLKMVTKDRELNGYIGRFVQKVDPAPGSQFVIFGDLHGAFHSFIRDLVFLNLKGIISRDLTIRKPYCYFVFNGNVVDQSPYSLETLTIIMQLMHRNPGRVFYIRGFHEDKEEWHNYSLKDELSIRARHLERKFDTAREKIPLNGLINRFFNTLPLALYLLPAHEEKKIDVVRISHYGMDYREINEKRFAGFLDLPGSDKPQTFKLTNKLTSPKKVEVNALITGEKLDIYYRKTQGLRLLGRERGILTWAVLSSPINSHSRLYEVFYDAFAILTTYPKLKDWTIALYNQDARTKLGVEKTRVFNLTSGIDITEKEIAPPEPISEDVKALRQELKVAREQIKELEEDITEAKEALEKIEVPKKPIPKIKKELLPEEPIIVKEEKPTPIMIGSTLDLSRGLKFQGRQVLNGAKLLINALNERGGIDGRLIDLVPYDDEYVPAKAKENINRFLGQNIDIILLPTGGPTLDAYSSIIKKGKVLVLFPITGALKSYSPEFRNIVHFRPSYFQETYILTKYAIKQLEASKIALFYQTDVPGVHRLAAGVSGFQKATEEEGFTNIVKIGYSRNDVSFERQAKVIEKENPDAIIFISTAMAAKSLITRLGIEFMSRRKLLGQSDLSEKPFKDFIKGHGLEVIIINVVPNPKESKIPIVEEFRERAQKKGLPIDTFLLEGYIGASLFIYALNQVKGAITKDSLREVFENIKDFEFKGLKLNFDPETRQLSQFLWLDTGKPEWKEISLLKEKKEEKKIKEVKKEIPPIVKVEEGAPIMIGSTLDLSRGLKFQGRQVLNGAKLFINNLNEMGGINGRRIDLVYYDDGYIPTKAKENINRLLNQKIDIILLPTGGPTLEAYANLVKDNKVLVLFPITGTSKFFTPEYQNIIHFRPSYFTEDYILMKYAIQKSPASKIAFFYQKDAMGFEKAAEDEGFTNIIKIPYSRNDVNFREQAKIIEKEDPDVIIFGSTSIAAKALITQVGIPIMAPKRLLGESDLSAKDFKDYLKRNGLIMATVNVVPNPKESELPIAHEFREKSADKDVDVFAFESYIGASLLAYALCQVKGAITKDSLREVFENIKDFEFKGLKLNFDPETRQLSQFLWLDTGKPEWEEISLLKKKKEEKIEKLPIAEKPEQPIIRLGSTLDLSKGIRIIGKGYKKALEYIIEKTNQTGGVRGKKIQLTILDDKYTPDLARENAELLLSKFNTSIFINPSGTPTIKSYLDLIKEKKILVLFPGPGTSIFRKPDLTNIINLGASYFDEAYILTKYMIENRKSKKIAFFYQADDFGYETLKGARKALSEAGLDESDQLEISYDRNDLNFYDAVKQIIAAKVDTIGFFSTSIAAKSFVRQMGTKKIGEKKLFGFSDLASSDFRQFMKQQNLKIIVSSMVPNPVDTNIAIVSRFQKEIGESKGALTSDIFSFKAFLGASLLIEVLKQIEDPITKDKIREKFESMHNYDFGGLILNFDKQTRQLLNSVWLDTGVTKWEKFDVKKIEKVKIEPEEEKIIEKPAELIRKLPENGEKPLCTVKLEDNVIRVGTTVDKTRSVKDLGLSILRSIEFVFNQINQGGGINGYQLELVSLDDEYDAKKARQNIEILINDYNIHLILVPLGTPTLRGYLDLVKEKKILVLFPDTGASIFRKPELKNLINLRPSLYEESYALTKYAIEKYHSRRFVFFCLDNEYGNDLLRGAKEALRENGISDSIDLFYQPDNINFDDQVRKIKESNSDAIGLFSAPIAARSLIHQLGTEFVREKKLFGPTELDVLSFKKFLSDNSLNILLGHSLPGPEKDILIGSEKKEFPIIKKFRKTVEESDGMLSMDLYTLTGYLGARLLIDVLKQMEKPITCENIIEKFEAMDNYDFGGIKLTFDPQTRQLLHAVWLDDGSDYLIAVKTERPSHLDEKKKKDAVKKIEKSQQEIST